MLWEGEKIYKAWNGSRFGVVIGPDGECLSFAWCVIDDELGILVGCGSDDIIGAAIMNAETVLTGERHTVCPVCCDGFLKD